MASISKPDVGEIEKDLRLFVKTGSWHELRAVAVPRGYGYRPVTMTGWFSDVQAMAKESARLDQIGGAIYFTLNPTIEDLSGRAQNHTMLAEPKKCTDDTQVIALEWLFVDIDAAKGLSDIAATQEQHEAALLRASEIRSWLMLEWLWPAPVVMDSGNGAYLLFPIHLENNAANANLIERVLKSLAAKFDDDKATIDTCVSNPSRIARVPGTLNRKGDNTATRPHRRSRILESPEEFEIVSREQLEQIAREAPCDSGVKSGKVVSADLGRSAGMSQELEQVLDALSEKHQIKARDPEPCKDGQKYVLSACLFDPAHQGGTSVAIIEYTNGAKQYCCLHEPDCKGRRKWGDVLRTLGLRQSTSESAGGDKGEANGSAEHDSWPDPEPLGGELPPVPAFDLRLLPEALRTLVQDTSERMQVPLDFPAIASVLCLAGAVGRRGFIQPKAEDSGWVVVPNLWGALIGLPGIMMKSPTINTMTKPLTSIEKLWRSLFEIEMGEYEHEKELADLRLTAWKQQVVAAEKGPKKPSPNRPDDSITKPVLKRLIVHDASPEKLHEILCENPAGVLMIRDELAGWLARLDEEGHGGERQFFLTLWNGDTPYAVDRIGRGSLYGEACCMSLLGGIQPSRLRNYLADALHDGPQNDGLFQRLQLMVDPDPIKEWVYTDRLPQHEAIAKAGRLYQRLVDLDVEQPRLYKFDPLAQELFVDWLTRLEQKLRNAGLHPALVCHLSKYRSLMPSLALLFQLADDDPDEASEGFEGGGGCPLPNNKRYLVSLEHAKQAAAFCEYLEAHARRVYSMIISPERAAAAELGRHLAAGWKRAEGTFTMRDVYQNDWSRLDTPERVRPALEILEDACWVRRIESEQRTGRPSEIYAINSRLERREEV
jgi:hypothetical protein